jgi:hypothetical protein
VRTALCIVFLPLFILGAVLGWAAGRFRVGWAAGRFRVGWLAGFHG